MPSNLLYMAIDSILSGEDVDTVVDRVIRVKDKHGAEVLDCMVRPGLESSPGGILQGLSRETAEEA